MYKGVIFDINGTMIFDSKYHRDVWRDFVPAHTGKTVSDEELDNNYLGRDNKTILLNMFGDNPPDDETLERYTYEKEAEYRRRFKEDREHFKLVDGLPELLGKFKASGIPMNLATGSEIKNLEFYFEYLDFGKWFDMSLAVYDDGSLPGKPSPDIYLRAAEKIKVAPCDIMVFEDSFMGVMAANNAGIGSVIAINESETKEYYDACGGVDFAASDFRSVMKYLGI